MLGLRGAKTVDTQPCNALSVFWNSGLFLAWFVFP
jgi:hypothetical protein